MRRVLAGVLACAILLMLPAVAGAASLPSDTNGRPGPDILYQTPATNSAPQLSNDSSGTWSASPILVSGASAYRSGEFLYQDWIYDDSGAFVTGGQVSNDPRFQGNGFSRPGGTYAYPTDTATFGNNSADLVEFRVKKLASSTAFRLTFNTMKDTRVTAATIAIGGTAGTLRAWPFSANVRSPAQFFLTVHGTSTAGAVAASFTDAVTGLSAGTATPSIDTTRRQITVTVPTSAWNPGTSTVRMVAGTGIWDATAGTYRAFSSTGSPSATQAGGQGALSVNPPRIFNLAFRTECQTEDPVVGSVSAPCEPQPNIQSPNAVSDPAWWRDKTQAHVLGSFTALATADVSGFFASVDFSKLANSTTDNSGVPSSGAMDRIEASHYSPTSSASTGNQGADYSQTCTTSVNATTTSANGCLGWLRGELQPYAIYVPAGGTPSGGYGMTLLLHSLDANYNQFLASANQSEFGNAASRGGSAGSIVMTPSGRGPDGWYYGYAAADTFEVWADIADKFTLNPDWTAIAGYSMGGYGTYKFAAQYPDLFAKAQPTVGPPGMGTWEPPADPQPGGARSLTNRMLESFRNIPILMWDGSSDELVPTVGPQAQADRFNTLGYRYEYDLFTGADHFALAINDEYGPAASFLGTTLVNRNPSHVSFAYNPMMDFSSPGTAPTVASAGAGYAYWLTGVTLASSSSPSAAAPLAVIDVKSNGFGLNDPTPSAQATGSGTLTGGGSPALAYTCQSKNWGTAPPTGTCNGLSTTTTTTRALNSFTISGTNTSAVTINARRADLTCAATHNSTTISITMTNCPTVGTLSVGNQTVTEGNSGTANMTFTVTLSGNTENLPVSIDYQTANGTATAGSDYTATSGVLTFAPGETTKTVSVPISGDSTTEPDETFQLQLTNGQFATPTSLTATGTITNDDGLPSLAIADKSQAEGNSGTANESLTVTLTGSTAFTTTVHYQTSDGSASSSSDYDSTSGDLTFTPGQTTKTIDVPVHGDTTYENDETFNAHLSSPTNATISDADGVGTITNDDSAPSLAVADQSQAEGNSGTANESLTVTLTGSTAFTTTVHYQTSDGSASSSSDYDSTSGDLTFTPGQTTKTIDVPVHGDTTYENDETFNVHLSSPTNATISDADGVGTITNDDSAPTLAINDRTQAEANSGTANMTFTVTLTGATDVQATVHYQTSNGTASSASDYDATSGDLTFNPGQTTKTIDVPIHGDTTYETDEPFSVHLSAPTNATISDADGVGTITNDDAAPTLAIADKAQAEGNSGTANETLTVTLSGATEVAATVHYQTQNGSASSASDYDSTSGDLTFDPGETTKTIDVPVNGDTTYENDETFTVHLSSPTNATVSDADGTGTITNDDTAPTLAIDDQSQAEGDSGSANETFTVTLSGATDVQATVHYQTQNGSASSASDYDSTSGDLTFDPGETTKTIDVPVNGDTTYENDETFTVHLSSPTNATVSDADGTGTITNDDTAPTLAIDDQSQAEGDSGSANETFTVTLSGATDVQATVHYQTQNGSASSASDYDSTSGDLTFDPGETTKTIDVPVNGDTTYENDETFTVHLSSPTNATVSDADGTGTITNDDTAPTLAIDDQSQAEGDSGSANETFTVTLSGATDVQATVHYQTQNGSASSASDYDSTSGDLTFDPGETTKTIDVPVNGDTTYENDETFTVHLSAPTDATISDADGTGTITNDDAAPTVSIADKSQAEGDSGTANESLTVSRSGATEVPITVHYQTSDGSASSSSDYDSTSGDLTINPGDSTGTVDVPVNGDTTYENDETFTVHLSAPTGATISDADGTGTIANDDQVPSLSIADQSKNEGKSGNSDETFTVTLTGGTALQVTVHYQTSNGSASSASDYTATSGDLTFDPGDTSKTIDVPIHGDTAFENDETFNVHLSSATSATISSADAVGTIVNDDPQQPIGASPLRVPLVPAFNGCTSANSTHGAPLNFPSCSQPVPSSSTAVLGSGAIGFVNYLACPEGSAAANCNTAGVVKPDLRLFASLRDVRCAQTGTPSGCTAGGEYNPNGAGPYTSACTTAATCGDGSVLASPYCAQSGTSPSGCIAGTDLTVTGRFSGGAAGKGVRITDIASGAGQDVAATVADIGFPVPMDCLPTPSQPNIGSICAVNTSANALAPGAVRTGDAATWQLGEVQVLDSGPNGTRGDSDDQPVAVQGVYLP